MTSVKIDQNELPEYVVRSTIVHPYDSAAGIGIFPVIPAGRHPKLRVESARLVSIDPKVSAENTADLKKGDGTVVVADLDSGTADYAIVEGNVIPGITIERNDALNLVVGAAGKSFVGLLFIDIVSID